MAIILIAEDEKNMQDIVVDYMKRGGHSCITADDGIDAVTILKNTPVDLAILDIMMPHLDGFSVCKIAREMYNLPIIFLTAKESEDDKLKGYDIGADDYMTKPFMPGELVARVKAHLRRQNTLTAQTLQTQDSSLYEFEGLTVDLDAHELFVDGQPVSVTTKEFEILKLLIENPRKVFSAQQIFETIWKTNCMENDARTVMVYISTLRKKLEARPDSPKYIISVRGVGYKFNQSL